jgi:hypothetical protein
MAIEANGHRTHIRAHHSDTNAIGKIAAITVNVANIVGFPLHLSRI